MIKHRFLLFATLTVFGSILVQSQAPVHGEKLPNIVYIMSDELAYYELSHMGNPYIKTPRIDRMAAEGIRFTKALAGAPVCAPLRCVLMTGKHMGHASVRSNGGGTPLRAGEATIASMLKAQGYATGGFGKWGAGGRGSTGVPEKHGFDIFVGYYDQVHAHSFYPPYIIKNSKELVLPGNKGGRSGKTYSHYVIMDEAIKFINDNKDKPFFCYLPITPPHGMYDIPAKDPACAHYKDKDWPQDVKNYAAMVTMVDNNLGTVLDLLKKLKLEENTIVFFAGDNGGQDRFRSKAHPRGFFSPNKDPKTGVEFRGGKGNLYEGGLRIPSLVRWPGTIKPGQVSDLIWYQPDVFPTIAELTKGKTPSDLDGISILPTLLGEKETGHAQEKRDMLYWEFGNQVAVRMGNWKAIAVARERGTGIGKGWQLYDLDKDISETNNIADENQKILAKMIAFAKASHTPAQPGTFNDTADHEKDRWAKWGTAKGAPKRKPAKSGKTGLIKVNQLKSQGLLPNTTWTIARVSSQASNNQRQAVHAIDGNPRTHWHTNFSSKLDKHPHELLIDLGQAKHIKGFRYLARQDGGWNGAVAKCEFYISNDKSQLGKPVASVTFKKVKTSQEVLIKKTTGRYVMLRVLSEVNGEAWGSVAELGVIGE